MIKYILLSRDVSDKLLQLNQRNESLFRNNSQTDLKPSKHKRARREILHLLQDILNCQWSSVNFLFLTFEFDFLFMPCSSLSGGDTVLHTVR